MSPERDDRYAASLTAEGRYRLLVERVTDYAIYMLDPRGIVSSWNAGAERFKGYTASEIIGQHFSKFYTEEDRAVDLPARALATAEREGKFEAEGWRVRKDGQRFWAHVVIDPIHDPSGELAGFAKITRDLTERLKTQRELELAREALFQSQKMDAIGQLTGGVAHDFNNLLMVILGSLELVRKRIGNDPRIVPLLENAIQGAERGAVLTRRMLAFARRQELKSEAVDVPSLVRGMTDLLKGSLGPSIEVETRFPPALSRAQADPNQLELALLNLAVNARDAMPAGGGIILGAREETVPERNGLALRPGSYVCLSVVDTGEGMDETTLARAAEPFFTTKGPGKGTGLGLSMVHGMVEQSGGALRLKSRRGEGTTVELWLPLATAEPAEAGSTVPRAPDPEHARPLRVLAVDDDSLVLMNTAAMLEDLGHVAVEASSGQEALVRLREAPMDLVITDQAMAGMSGHELAAAISADRPELPVIIATGYAELPPGAGLDLPKLAKPFDQGALARAIAEAIGRVRREA